jgi:predicted glycosyltransferase
VARYLLSSHDGFGLGHIRRNCLIARALLAAEPDADITMVTGLGLSPAWLGGLRARVVRVPTLLKDSAGGYRPIGMTFDNALGLRSEIFARTVAECRPDVVVVDRHPLGIAGELARGLSSARECGARLFLGLRDVLDDPAVVSEEMAGAGWAGVTELFDEALVYGARTFLDHEAEYGLPLRPRYCGWVTDCSLHIARREPGLLAVTAGGGGDGDQVFRMGVALVEGRPEWRAIIAAGPYAGLNGLREHIAASPARGRIEVLTEASGCGVLFARASAAVQMAGYNSTFEALAAGQRPILVPRTTPRREQAIRAERLGALDLADVTGEDSRPAAVDSLLDRPRELAAHRLEQAGIRLDGAARAAGALRRLVGVLH